MKDNILLKVPEPQFLFNEIEPSKQEYTLLLFDILHYTLSKLSKFGEYIVFRSKLIKGFDKLYLDHSLVYLFHFPKKSFEIAWIRAVNFKQIKEEEKYDCLITFKRETKKKLVITDRKYLEVGKYDFNKLDETTQ